MEFTTVGGLLLWGAVVGLDLATKIGRAHV